MIRKVIFCLLIVYIILCAATSCDFTITKPEIKHGEFPFSLIYEANGKRFEVNDTLICEYEGIGADESIGKYRKWKSYLQSGNKYILLFKNEYIEIFFTPNINHWEAGAFYMGDTEIYDSINDVFPNAWYIDTSNEKNQMHTLFLLMNC